MRKNTNNICIIILNYKTRELTVKLIDQLSNIILHVGTS
jgi:hypothetical protein